MTVGEASITPTPKRCQLNANCRRYQAPNLCSSSSPFSRMTRLMASTPAPPLSPLNVNANAAAHQERRGCKNILQSNTRGGGAVVWNNAVFRCDGVWGSQSSSTSTDSDAPQSPLEISQDKKFSNRLHSEVNRSPDIESTASTSSIVVRDSSCLVERKRVQSVQKSPFTAADALASIPVKLQDEGIESNPEESIGHPNDPEIQQIEMEILRLTQKLGELRLQKVADQRNQEARDQPEEGLNGNKGDQKKIDHDNNNYSEKGRRGRVVPAKFLQLNSKPDRKLLVEAGGIQRMSPREARRKAASLGPSEHSRFLGKPKDDIEFKVESSARKGNKMMRSLSLSPTCHNQKTSAKKPAITSLKFSGKLHCKKLFQESETNKSTNTSTSCINKGGQPGQQVEKHSFPLKNARIVASRYGRTSTPSKSKDTQTPTCSLSSLKNVHGKRHFQEEELECRKGRLNYSASASKRRSALGTNAYPSSRCVSTPNSKAPLNWGTRKMGTTTTPRRQHTRQTNNLPGGLFPREESSNRKAFTSSPDLFGVHQEKITRDGADNYSFSLGLPESPEIVQPDRLKLPRIKTMRFIAQSPRDSGCIKRAVDRIGKKSFFASDGIRRSHTVDKRNGRSVDSKTSSRRGFILDIKPRLSFEGDEPVR